MTNGQNAVPMEHPELSYKYIPDQIAQIIFHNTTLLGSPPWMKFTCDDLALEYD